MTTVIDPLDSQGNAKLRCLECGHHLHRLDVHVRHSHQMTVAQYRERHGADARVISDYAQRALEEDKAKRASTPKPAPSGAPPRVLLLGVARVPIREGVPPEDQALVPAHDEDYLPGVREMQAWEAIGLAVEARENALIVGPTGCGKSAGVLELAVAANQPLQRKNLHGDVRASDFVGEKVIDVEPESGQAVVMWRDGILTSAMRRGHWLLLDELDAAPPQILFVLQSVLENGGRLVLAANHGEVVVPHPEFRVFATANTLGRGDETGLYTGTNVLNEAFLDRFGVVVEADYPDADTEARILVKRARVKPDTARKMVECATKVREAMRKEQCFCTFSTRRLIMWAGKAKKLGRGFDAARLTVLNRLAGDDRKFVLDVIERVFPPHPTTREVE